jgi:hypothetical protein
MDYTLPSTSTSLRLYKLPSNNLSLPELNPFEINGVYGSLYIIDGQQIKINKVPSVVDQLQDISDYLYEYQLQTSYEISQAIDKYFWEI